MSKHQNMQMCIQGVEVEVLNFLKFLRQALD